MGISRMPPQEKVRGSQANVRISNTKEDEAKGDKHIVRDLGRDGSPKCRLRKTSADLRQMSGSQIPKRMRQKVPKAKGKCPDLKCTYVCMYALRILPRSETKL